METDSSPRATSSPADSVAGEVHSVGREASWLLAGRAIVALTGWAGTAIIARELSPNAWGGYSFVFGLFGILGVVVDLQVGRIVLRQVLEARDDADRVVGSYSLFRVLIGLAAMALGIAFVLIGGYEDAIVLGTLIVGTSLVFMSPGWGLRVWFQARLRLRPVAVAMIAGAIVQLGAVVLVAATPNPTIAQFAVPTLLGQVLVLVWLAVVLRAAGVRPRLRVEPTEWWAWVKESAPLAVGFALVSIYLKVDIVLLSKLDTLDSVGLYGIGYKFADLVTFVPIALLTPVLTVMVTSANRESPDLGRHFRQAFVLLFVAATAFTVVFAVAAEPTIELFYGPRYREGADAARLLVAGAGVGFLTHLCVTTLVAIGRNSLYALAGILGLAVNVAMNVALIPAFSYNGSAVATVVTEAAVLALLVVGLHRAARVVDVPWGAVGRTSAAAAGLAGAYYGITYLLPWWVGVAGAVAVFVGLLHVFGVDGPGGLRGLIRNARFSVEASTSEEPTPAVTDA
jgi:O-antigen/teichoic acid export membrane protein